MGDSVPWRQTGDGGWEYQGPDGSWHQHDESISSPSTTPGRAQWRQRPTGAWEYLASDGRWYVRPPTTGLPMPYGRAPDQLAIQPGNGLAVAALVLGITSIIFSWLGLLTLAQVVLAITFGGLGVAKANRQGASGRGPAVAGIILGSIGFALYFVIGLSSLGLGWII